MNETTAVKQRRQSAAEMSRELEGIVAEIAEIQAQMQRDRVASDRVAAEARAIGERTDRRLEDLRRLMDSLVAGR